ncbi:hypothetical protein TWF696_005726 [Orbilia brochopaga]|uniref:Uncharacterized protein n=1 Tax=Orbilia brochopaga TaxID=3140254 RepID=A0AAV9UVE4_9PEZI
MQLATKALILSVPLNVLTVSALPLYRSPQSKSTVIPYSLIYRRAKDITPAGSSGIEPLDTDATHWTTPPAEPPDPDPGPPPMRPYIDKSTSESHALETPPSLPVAPLPPPDAVRSNPDGLPSKPAQPDNPGWKKLSDKDDTIRL